MKLIAQNRKAHYNYTIIDSIEAGIVLLGSEVKSLRNNGCNITQAYAGQRKGKIFLFNCYIKEYEQAGRFNHEPIRPRLLLLHKKESNKLQGLIKQRNHTLLPLKLYFNLKGIAKLELGLGVGKKKQDKRQAEKLKEWKREKRQL